MRALLVVLTLSLAARLDAGLVLSTLRPDCRLSGSNTPGENGTDLRCRTAAGVTVRPIHSLVDLRGQVQIRSEADALEFVRLFTTRGVWLSSGIATFAEPLVGDRADPIEFTVSKAVFSRCCAEPRVERKSEPTTHFRVTRTLVDRGYRIFEVSEMVGPDGSWRIVSKRLRSRAGRQLGRWVISAM